MDIIINWAATWDFQQCGFWTWVDSDEPVQPPFKLRNSKWYSVSSLTIIGYSSDSKGSDQTVCLRRLIWGFAGHTYHIGENLMSRLIYLRYTLEKQQTVLHYKLYIDLSIASVISCHTKILFSTSYIKLSVLFMVGKQCRTGIHCSLRECSIKIWIQMKTTNNNHLNKNALVQLIRVGNSIQLK